MKKILLFLLTALLSFSPIVVRAQGTGGSTPSATTVSDLVTAIRNASPADRQQLVQNAIRTNPEISSSLIAALITAFPAEAAAYTKTVVDTVVGLSIPTEAKASILTAVASSAVPAALQIPPSAVTDLVAAVNAVKEALANVPPDLTPAVANYIAPITADSKEVIITNETKDTEIVSQATL